MRLPELRIDSVFLFSLVGVGLFGLLNLYSAVIGQEDLFFRQLAATGIGGIAGAVLAVTDYRILRKYSIFFYAAGCALLLATIFWGHEVKATKSWISFGAFSVQPSELFKGIFILHLAAYLGRIQREHRATLTRGLFLPVLLLSVPMGLILYQGDAGTAAVYVPIFFVMIYMANLHFSLIGISLTAGAVAGVTTAFRIYTRTAQPEWDIVLQKYMSLSYSSAVFGGLAVICVTALVWRLRVTNFRGGGFLKFTILLLFVLFAGIQAGEAFYNKLKPHQKNRVASFFKPRIDPRGAGYQAIQAEIAVGSGGLFGKGYLKGTQKGLGFLPEQWTDFAFSVVAEEWGFAGSTSVLIVYAMLIGSALLIGRHATDLYGCLLAVGVAAMYFIHMGIGVAMNIGSFPVVGIPMPFLSYGGSAQVLNFAAAGIVLSVARHRRLLAA